MSTKDQFIDMAQRGILHFQKRLYISCSITRCQVTIFILEWIDDPVSWLLILIIITSQET